ncbi:MAG: penicillin acylase family protein [Rhodospirillaceae bacterium]
MNTAAYALGLTQAHLRLGQMAILRRITQGRLAESAGPIAAELDAALHAFNFRRAVPDIKAQLPPTTRRWMERYTAGINAYAAQLAKEDLPHEMELLAIDWEPWTIEDSLAIGRLTGIDINWGTMLGLIQIEDRELRNQTLARASALSGSGTVSFTDAPSLPSDSLAGLTELFSLARLIGRSGSNSVVVAPERSASGAPLIANDPHLGFLLPNPWMIAGLRSPSYAMVGMIVPGTPVFGFGRTPHLAWGGTNLRATTSQWVRLDSIPQDQIQTVETEIGVRFWLNETAEHRETPYGPVLTDAAILPELGQDFAIRWIGHGVSDETTALLNAMKAETVFAFQEAMRDFALPPQTFLVADKTGNIAGMTATMVPARQADTPLSLTVASSQADRDWQSTYGVDALPQILNPEKGYIASANNRSGPDGAAPFGGFFPQDERIRRLEALLISTPTHSLDSLRALQIDTVSPLSLELIRAMAPALQAQSPESDAEQAAIALLLAWNGDYAITAREPVVFEALMISLQTEIYQALDRAEEGAVYAKMNVRRRFLLEDMADLSPAQWRVALTPALAAAAEAYQTGQVWGDLHRLKARHVLGNIPVIGGRYEFAEFAVPGSRETIMKTDHDDVTERHVTRYGAQSRHLSDMADLDANYFVLFGGQDGHLSSPQFADQVPLWREGRSIQVPLSPDGLARSFPREILLTPRS